MNLIKLLAHLASLLFVISLSMSNAKAAVSCPLVSTTSDPQVGIFSLEEHDNELYVGGFGYDTLFNQPSSANMLWKYDGQKMIPIGLTKRDLGHSESVCAMKSFGDLFLGSERAGINYSYNSGINKFARLNNLGQRDVCDFEVSGSTIAAPETHGATVIFSKDGKVWNSSRVWTNTQNIYLREMVFFQGNWFAYGTQRTDNKPVGFMSDNLVSWRPIPVPGRVFRASVIQGKLYLSIASYPRYINNSVAIFTTTDGITYQEYYKASDDVYSHIHTVYNAVIDGRNTKVATVSTGFKPLDGAQFGKSGSSALMEFDDKGRRRMLCEFTGQEYADATEIFQGSLYIGTQARQYDSRVIDGFGGLYRVDGITLPKQEGISPMILRPLFFNE